MSAPITVRKLPAGSNIFIAIVTPNFNSHDAKYSVNTTTEDLYLERYDAIPRETYGHDYTPPSIKALINNNTGARIELYFMRRTYLGLDTFIYVFPHEIVEEQAKWPDGSNITVGEHFEVAAGSLLLECPQGTGRWDNRYDLFDYKDEIEVKTVARKYKGKTDWFYVLGADIPQGAKPGLYFHYADGLKAVHVDDVVKAAAPGPRKESTSKGPTFRQVFVAGTKWKVTADISVPGFDRTPVTYPNGHKSFDYTLVEGKGGTIPVGIEFKVDEKSTTYGPHYAKGVWMPVKFDGINPTWIRISDVNGKVERIMTADASVNADGTVNIDHKDVIPVYYIFDTAEQKYYKNDGYDYNRGQYTYEITYSEKGTKGCKSWKRLADVRRAVMEFSGYYHNLPGADRSDNYFSGGPKRFDIPDTWEIHEIDKTTKGIVRKIDVVDSLKRSWSLRGLTVKYGSAVRAVYSDLEKKKKLEEFSAMLVFNKKEDDRYYDYELTDEEKAGIDEALENVDKADYKRGKGETQAAVAVKDIGTGVQIRLSYNGDMEVALIDLTKMAEHVG